MLKRGFIRGVKNFPIRLGMFVYESNSTAIKNGYRDGTTEFAQSFKPFFVA